MVFDIYYLEFGLLSLIPLPIFWYVFRFKLRALGLGIIAIILAIIIEGMYVKLLDDGYMILMVVLFAPIIEETLKFILTYYKKNERIGMGVGLGFAFIENTMYYVAYPYMLPTLIMLREFQDPIMHSTATSVSSGAWHGKWYLYFCAIGIHIVYNIVALSDSVLWLSLLAISYVMILVYFYKIKKLGKIKNKDNEIKTEIKDKILN